jgi:hypothetical protein
MIGAVVSVTVTVNMQVLELPAASVAVLVTVVVPSGNVAPDAGVETTVTVEQSSLARTVKLTAAEQLPGSLGTMMLAGQTMEGGELSVTVTVNVQAD